jgi:acyl carrier protein
MTQPTRDEILEKLGGALSRASNGRAKLERLDDDAKIIDDIGLSSLDLLEMRCEIEELWLMKLTDNELMGLRTVGDAVRLIQERASPARG